MFDPDRSPPALFEPGAHVRFVASMTSAIEVVAPGIASTIQDRGRPGFAHLGVSPSGAVDPRLASLTNRLVGNPDEAAVIETCGDLVAALHGGGADRHVVGAGADVDRRRRDVPRRPVTRRASGTTSPCAAASTCRRCWARGRPTRCRVSGRRRSATGDVLPIGAEPESQLAVDQAPGTQLRDVVRVSPGPRLDWFEPRRASSASSAGAWTVTDSSRVGVRLSGVRLTRRVTRDLPSEGLVRGAVQVPPDSDPVMLLADHPTTGGYPVIAVVHPDDVAVVAQTRPGGAVRFTDRLT